MVKNTGTQSTEINLHRSQKEREIFFLTEERRINHNIPNFHKQRVSKCMTNVYGRTARNVINQNKLMAHQFSANGISLRLGKGSLF